jgi:hypothetical protein
VSFLSIFELLLIFLCATSILREAFSDKFGFASDGKVEVSLIPIDSWLRIVLVYSFNKVFSLIYIQREILVRQSRIRLWGKGSIFVFREGGLCKKLPLSQLGGFFKREFRIEREEKEEKIIIEL